ncbi:MAG: exosortase-associated EpsI family protein [Pirellulaceae bacterium]|jgi:hypothetical protein
MNKFSRRQLPILLFSLFFFFFSGAVQGWFSGRWVDRSKQQAISQAITELPTSVGDWTMQKDVPLGKSALALLNPYGYINRVYANEKTGWIISIAVLYGLKGPIAVHTPEVCYSSRDFVLLGSKSAYTLPISNEGTLWSQEFQSRKVGAEHMMVYHGWSDGGPWMAAKNPRFLRTETLAKVQIAAFGADKEQDPIPEFLEQFIPLLRTALGGGT